MEGPLVPGIKRQYILSYNRTYNIETSELKQRLCYLFKLLLYNY